MYDHLSIYLSFYLSIFLSLVFLYININTSINVSKPAIHGYPQNIKIPRGLERNLLQSLFFNSSFSVAVNFPLVLHPALPRLLKVTPAVYPHLNVFIGKLNSRNQSRPTQLKISKPRKEHSCGSPEFPNSKFEANQSRGSCFMIGQTNRQTDKQRLQLYICTSLGTQLLPPFTRP